MSFLAFFKSLLHVSMHKPASIAARQSIYSIRHIQNAIIGATLRVCQIERPALGFSTCTVHFALFLHEILAK